VNEPTVALTDDAGNPLRLIPRGTFQVAEEQVGGRFQSRLFISGPIADYTDSEILLHFGGDERFGDRVERYADGRAWVHVWSD
jgi:hypothetical protein